MLHSAVYAAPEIVDYLLRKPDIAALVNQRDHYNEDDQWAVYYYAEAELNPGWVVVKVDRNRMVCCLAMAKTRKSLRKRATIRFEGKGDKLGEESLSELDRAKASYYRSLEPDRYPQHYAMEAGNVVLVKGLLDKGANVNQRDRFGMTPLHVAAKHRDKDLVELLLERGADRSLVDNTNSTAFEVAQDNREIQRPDIERENQEEDNPHDDQQDDRDDYDREIERSLDPDLH